MKYLFLPAIFLVACTNTPSKQDIKEPPVQAHAQSLTHYEYTVEYSNEGMGNMAQRIPDYVHVLSQHHNADWEYENMTNQPYELWGQRPYKKVVTVIDKSAIEEETQKLDEQKQETEIDPDVEELNTTINKNIEDNTQAKTKKKEIKVNDHLALYEKYCDVGIGMTNADWDLFDQLGGVDSIPKELIDNCIHPKA